MKLQQLSQPILVKLLDLDERVQHLTEEADAAESNLEHARMVVNGNDTTINADDYAKVRDSFNDMVAQARTARAKADAQQRVLSSCKVFVDTLPPNTRLLPVYSNGNGADLAAIRAELKQLRDELRVLNHNPPPDPDIARRVDDYINTLSRSAPPLVRGFAQGQQLDVKWPSALDANRNDGSGFVDSRANPLLLFAALFPAELAKLILRSIAAAQPLSASQHAERVAYLTARIAELCYLDCAAVEKNGGEFDVTAPPQCVLGVKLESPGEGDAAA
jgi:hypothetical protein